MRNFHSLLAQTTLLPSDVMPSGRRVGLTFKELLMVLGAVAFVTLLVVIWAVYFRKRSNRHSHHHHHHHHDPEPEPSSEASVLSTDASAESSDGRRYRRKRRRRRDHRPRNPTLAETGGLPPLRPEQPPDPLP